MPIAFFSQYYRLVTDTVDGVRIPLRNAGGTAILFASLALGTTAFLLAYWNLSRRSAIAIGLLGLALIPSLHFFYPGPLELFDLYRPRGVQAAEAQENYEAVAITASAINRYVARTSKWPDSWLSLNEDLSASIKDGIEFPFHSTRGASITKIKTNHWSLDAVQNCVDVEFIVDLETVVDQDWMGFTPIRAHKPAYNMYREQLNELIQTIRMLKLSEVDR